MPIKGLTDQPRSFYEIGQLRKGAPKPKKGNRPGEDLTYFRATFNEGEERAATMFYEAYGDEPREINIRLPFNEANENFDAWREAYVAGGLVHRCDGETVQYEIDRDTGEIIVLGGRSVETGELVKCDGSADCKPTGRLKVIVPELRRLAFMTALTTSVWDILNISSQLEGIRFANNGKLQGVPLILKRRPKRISTPGGENGKRARYEKWLLSIEPHPDWVESRILALPEAEEERPLELPPGIPDTNGEEIEGEIVYDLQESGEVWEDERPVYEAEELPFADEPEGGSPEWDMELADNLTDIVAQHLEGELPLPGWVAEIREAAAAHEKAGDPANNGAVDTLLRKAEKRVTLEQFYAAVNVILEGREPEEMMIGEWVALQRFVSSDDFEAQVIGLLS